jgi:hypothetical protein
LKNQWDENMGRGRTRMRRISADLIRAYPLNPYDPRSMFGK